MPSSAEDLEAKARQSLSQLFAELRDSNVPSQLYRNLFLQSADSLAANKQIVFDEIACFAAFCIAINATQYIRKHRFFGLLRGDPDETGAALFARHVFDYLTRELDSRPSREAYTFYSQYRAPNASEELNPFAELASLQPDLQAFQTRFLNTKFKIPLFANRLAKVIKDSLPASTKLRVYSRDLLPFGREIAEDTADITKEIFSTL